MTTWNYEEIARRLAALRRQEDLVRQVRAERARGRGAEPPQAIPFIDRCACSHGPISPVEAMMMVRALYAVGIGYHTIADLTRLGITHSQMREILARPDLADQAATLAHFAS